MKSILILAFLAVIACDAPQRTRYPTTAAGLDVSGEVDNTTGTTGGNGSDSNTEIIDTGDSSSDEPGYSNCNIAHQYNAGTVGNFGVCQNDNDERQFKASFAQSDLSVGSCFVPMHIEGTQSFNVGRAECVHNQSGKTYYMTLYKSRSESINGVMLLKATSVNAFMQCMSAKADYINAHPGCLYNSTCVNNANQYASQVCSSFVQNHGNNYRQVQFN